MEDIVTATESIQDYMKKVIDYSWFTNKNVQMKKEAIVIEIVRSLQSISDTKHLREAELALILFKRQYGISNNCRNYVLKVMNKLFFKYLNLLRLARKTKHSTRQDAFIRSLITLSVEANYGEDVTEKLDMLEIRQEQRKSKHEKRRPSKEATRSSRAEQDKLQTQRREEPEKTPKTSKETELFEETEEGETVSPEELEQRRAKRRQELANKLRMKAQERQAMQRVMAKGLDKVSQDDSQETPSFPSVPEEGSEEEEVEEDRDARRMSTGRIRRKKKALEEEETESSSSHGTGFRKMEEEISMAALEAKRRRAQKEAEAAEGSKPPSRSDRTPTSERTRLGTQETPIISLPPKDHGLPPPSPKGPQKRALKKPAREDEVIRIPGAEYEDILKSDESYGSEEEEVEEEEQEMETGEIGKLKRTSSRRRKRGRRRGHKAKTHRGSQKDKQPVPHKPTETGMLLRFPMTPKQLPRDAAVAMLKDFLDKQIEADQLSTAPSITLRALANAFQDPDKAEHAEQLMQAFEQALGLDEKDPATVMQTIRERLDAGPSGKMAPFNKMVNLLSIILAMDPESAEQADHVFESSFSSIIQEQAALSYIGQPEVAHQRQQLLAALVEDITSQLKYEYAVLNDLAPGQRAVWMALETQADTMRECCEKIGFLISSHPPIDRQGDDFDQFTSAQLQDTYEEFTRVAGMTELETSSRQLQSRTRTTQQTSSAKRVKRMTKPDQKKKRRPEEEEDEQVTEPPETTGSFEDKPPGEEKDGSSSGSAESDQVEIDLTAVENELRMLDEEPEEILKAMEAEEMTEPTKSPSSQKTTDVPTTSTAEGVYPDPAFLRGEVKRFVLGPEESGM
ncbi:unnamed protein product [Echinostoma caproni]|uniref:MI domain-containing protein n=1 Tax=Echinostoma caproni TaxID=27848 RepID=A0A183AV08_9TREM|nr:unnamed protein product [Echinostoma caproni]